MSAPIPTVMQRSLLDLPSQMWRVTLEDKATRDRHQWDGWARSSTEATQRALGWCGDKFGAFRAARVLDCLQVGA